MADAPPRLPWLQTALGTAVSCAPATATLLILGLSFGSPAAGAIAAGASVTTGFGAFKRVSGSTLATMALACAGMGVSTMFGTLTARYEPLLLLAVLFWGFVRETSRGRGEVVKKWARGVDSARRSPLVSFPKPFQRAVLIPAAW